MRLYSLLGNSQKLDGGAMFGNAPRALWSRWSHPDDANRIDLACRALLVQDLDGRTVLFEAGIGAFFDPALRERYGVIEDRHVLIDSLAAIGVSPNDIDVVVLSHLHFDHAGGLLQAYEPGRTPQLVFENASYVVGAEHWQRATHPHPRDRASFIPELAGLLESTGRLEKVAGDYSETLGQSVRFHHSDGHTPGLLLAEIRGRDADSDLNGVVFCADLIPGEPWVHVPITMGYDRNAELLIDEKRVFLEDMQARDIGLFFTHDPQTAMGRVARDEKGKFVLTQRWPQVQALELELA